MSKPARQVAERARRRICIALLLAPSWCWSSEAASAAGAQSCSSCREFHQACIKAHSQQACKNDHDICMKHCRSEPR